MDKPAWKLEHVGGFKVPAWLQKGAAFEVVGSVRSGSRKVLPLKLLVVSVLVPERCCL